MAANSTRIAIEIHSDELARTDGLVRAGYADSREELLSHALHNELRRLERLQVDALIREMANDEDALAENRRVHEEFDDADKEAWAIVEQIDGLTS